MAVDGRRHALVAPNDPLYPDGLGGNGPAVGQWYLRANAGAVASSLDVEPAWAQGAAGACDSKATRSWACGRRWKAVI